MGHTDWVCRSPKSPKKLGPIYTGGLFGGLMTPPTHLLLPKLPQSPAPLFWLTILLSLAMRASMPPLTRLRLWGVGGPAYQITTAYD